MAAKQLRQVGYQLFTAEFENVWSRACNSPYFCMVCCLIKIQALPVRFRGVLYLYALCDNIRVV